MIKKSIFLFLGIICLLNFIAVSSAIADTETFDKTYEITSESVFEISNRDGKVKIEGWDGDKIEIHAIKQTCSNGKLEDVKIQVAPGAIFKVETIHLVNNPKVSVSYDIRVPLSVRVKRVVTSNGKIVLEKTQGDTEVETSNGKIVIEDITGNINAATSNGAIDISQVKGFVRAETSNGSIDVESVDGVIELETSNGAIEAEVPAIGDNGLFVRTNNGKIELYLAADLNVDIEAKTSNSDIELDQIEVVAQQISRNRLRGRIGLGGKKISCRTSNGAIRLGRLK
jgi:DUF4097 and DUF4098 domain-containing protein YvlB